MYIYHFEVVLNFTLFYFAHYVDEIRDQITTLKNEGSSLAIYGRDMPQIVDAIKRNEHRFTHLPRGPLGKILNRE